MMTKFGKSKELEKRGHKFARYADDFTIIVQSQRAGERVLRNWGVSMKCQLFKTSQFI
jgi:RNA-directed DNA polymerase